MKQPAGFSRVLTALGALTLIAMLAGASYGLWVMHSGFSARDAPSAPEAAAARTLRRLAGPSRVKALKNPVASSPEVLAEARAHWADHCALCHANDGSGQTAIGRNLYPKTPDMRKDATQSLSDGELYAVIKNGVRLTGMPAWGEPGDDDKESWALVRFIRRLSSLTPADLKEMEDLNPRSSHERNEDDRENEFLKGEGT